MKPAEFIAALEADVSTLEQQLVDKRAALESVRKAYGFGEPCFGVQAERPRKVKGRKAQKVRRAGVRRQPLAPGAIGDRIVSILTEYAAPMRKARLVSEAKAKEHVVMAEVKRLRDEGRITTVGATSNLRYSLPKFANVIVAEDAA